MQLPLNIASSEITLSSAHSGPFFSSLKYDKLQPIHHNGILFSPAADSVLPANHSIQERRIRVQSSQCRRRSRIYGAPAGSTARKQDRPHAPEISVWPVAATRIKVAEEWSREATTVFVCPGHRTSSSLLKRGRLHFFHIGLPGWRITA